MTMKTEHLRLHLLLLILLLTGRSDAQLPHQMSSPKYEIRAVWLTTIGGIDWPHSYYASTQREELCRTLDELKAAGINTVFLQTRVRATTIYPSIIEPWDGCITGHPGKAATYDPLQYAIEECHKRGMQLHAWVVTIPIGKWKNYGCTQLRKRNPQLVIKIGEEGYMNPEAPETSNYLMRICREITSSYDVDGIHLDYIRYPETWKMKVNRAEGRANITRIVRTIYNEVKATKPWVMVSCSPIGKYDDLTRYRSNGWNARSRVFQDAQQWLKEGIMDALFPMMYFRDNNFFPFAIDWQEHSYGKYVVPGLGIYFLDPREGRWSLEDIERQMNVIRELGMGHCFFRSKFLTDNTKGIYDLSKSFNRYPSLIPPLYWLSSRKPEAPKWIEIEDNNRMCWQASERGNVYNVYASTNYPVDITKAENLVATRLQQNSLLIRKNMNYAVTTQDRFGQESDAIQLLLVPNGSSFGSTKAAIQIADKTVTLPAKPSTLDADFLIIETLQGQAVKTIPFRGTQANTAQLPEGIYQWRSLDKKGHHHRLGFFAIKKNRRH